MARAAVSSSPGVDSRAGALASREMGDDQGSRDSCSCSADLWLGETEIDSTAVGTVLVAAQCSAASAGIRRHDKLWVDDGEPRFVGAALSMMSFMGR